MHLHHPSFRPLAYGRVTASLSVIAGAIIALVARTMDSNNMSAASLPATIACGDGIAPLSRIAPRSGYSRCRRTRGMAASDRSYRPAQASETASGLQWSQVQRKFSLEIPFVRTVMNLAFFETESESIRWSTGLPPPAFRVNSTLPRNSRPKATRRGRDRSTKPAAKFGAQRRCYRRLQTPSSLAVMTLPACRLCSAHHR